MDKKYHFVYCENILGVRTNIRNFKWVYGSVAPVAEEKEYNSCIVKFDICLKPEKNLRNIDCFDKKFQSYFWNESEKRLSFRRKLPMNIDMGYDLKIDENTVYVEIGEHYYKFIKNRTMNLHGMYYLLSDVANIMLMKNGYITLYASSVHNHVLNRSAVIFAPPNTGKTVSVLKLCDLTNYNFVGEDIVISNGSRLFSCPWTSSYRKKQSESSLQGRTKPAIKSDMCQECELTDIVVLSIGNKNKVQKDKDLAFKYISMLNGYLFNYYSSPIVKIMGYFNDSLNKTWEVYANKILGDMTKYKNCHLIQQVDNCDFANCIEKSVFGDEK